MGEYTRTDLAYESIGTVQEGENYSRETRGSCTVTRLHIRDESEEVRFGKPRGTYVTVLCDRMWLMSEEARVETVALVAEQLGAMCRELCHREIDSRFRVLVAGLGNADITPDAIGPRSVGQLNVTRHLRQVDEALYHTVGRCEISALVPGVLGQTGIETVELIRGAVENARPHAVVAIDALAARACERLGTTVQLSSNGICPGSGIGNHRKAICRDTVGVPVIGLGVPTVVNTATLVYDALRKAGVEELGEPLRRVLDEGQSFFVSPKESDVITLKVSELIADAVDMAFSL